jgi:hypothetical protein
LNSEETENMAQSNALHSHDAESLRQMALALDSVWDQLPESYRSDATRQRLAGLIVNLFEHGERDPARLSQLAFAELFPPSREGEGA